MESNTNAEGGSKRAARPTVLAIGGLDPSGGAGIAVDAAAVRAVGAHGAVVVAVTTVQSGRGFVSASASSASAVSAAVTQVLESQEVRAIKTGALGDAAVVEAVATLAERRALPPLIVDPVFSSTTGGALFDPAGRAALRDRLVPRAAIVTPNASEAAALGAGQVAGVDDMLRAAVRLLALGCGAALVKGGHLEGDEVVDVFADDTGRRRVFREARIGGGEVRGTGCALAAMIAGHVALGRDLEAAVGLARAALRRAISAAYSVGAGPRVLSFEGPAPRDLDLRGEGRES